jgi:hypothetical protein
MKKYVVTKYIYATSVKDALSKERSTPPDDIFLHEKWEEKTLDKEFGFYEKRTTEKR